MGNEGLDSQISPMRALVVRIALLVAVAAAVCLTLPAGAQAEVYDTDMVGTIALSQNAQVKEEAPDVVAGYGGLVTSEGKILWARDINAKVPMASTTKIMTALVVLEQGALDDRITVSENAATIGGSTAYLVEGDTLTMQDMLYAMMLPSGNDAATALAEHYGGTQGEAGFVALMNEKAAALGMSGTHFSSPTGLEDEDNYTTVSDYLKLVTAAMGSKMFTQVVSTPTFAYMSSQRGYEIELESTNLLLEDYDGMIGVKTGYTDAAGYCFVGAAKRGDIALYSVVFDSTDEWQRFADTQELLDWGFEHYRVATLLDTETVVGNAVDTDWLDKTVPVVAAEPVTLTVFDYDPDITQTVELNNRGGIERGVRMGSVTWTRGEEELASVNLVSSVDIAPPDILQSAQIGWTRFASIFTGDKISVEQSVDLAPTFQLIDSYGKAA
ncbi:MAG: D-alanyl-D-alanine carboxypeptidase family protein [Coriobacteriales bacterium]|jgi:D-alanyl-D-alanine carboxypeptidase (penicillin-binding protein 5/6)